MEERAREIFKGSPDRIVVRYTKRGIRLVADGESKVPPLLIAVRELYGQMPAIVQAFLLDVMVILSGKKPPAQVGDYAGGLSGAPCRRAVEIEEVKISRAAFLARREC